MGAILFCAFLSSLVSANNFNQQQPVEKNPLSIVSAHMSTVNLEPGQIAELKLTLRLKAGITM